MVKRVPLITSAVLLCIMVVFTSCKDNPSKVQKEPPKLPPAESMSINLSAFDQGMAQKGLSELTTNNYDQARSTAGFMKLILELNLAFPKALLMGAHSADASFIENGKWEWSFSETKSGDTFSIRLVAIREGQERVKWKFYISSSLLKLNDHLFFEGTTYNKGLQGKWTYYSLLDTGTSSPVYEITWLIKGEDHAELKMEMLADHFLQKKGTFLEYTFDGTYKAIIYFDAATGETTKIRWNAETKAGFIIAPDYNNGKKACWDENFQDITCGL